MSRVNYGISQDIVKVEQYGKVIYLLGSSSYGSVNQPVKVKGLKQAQDIFGLEGTLIDSYKHLLDIDEECEAVLCKVTGLHSMLHLNINMKGQNVVPDGLVLKSKYANEVYNKINVTLDADSIMFKFPPELGGGIKTYTLSDYEILGLLIRAINEDTKMGLNHVLASCSVSQGTPLVGSLVSVNPSSMYMYGGDSGLKYSKNELYFCLQDTYNMLQSDYIDIIVPLDAFMDDCHPKYYFGDSSYENMSFYSNNRDYLDLDYSTSFHRQLIDFCKHQMQFGLTTHGVIGFNKVDNLDYILTGEVDYVSQFLNFSPLGTRFDFGIKIPGTDIDDGCFISPVAGEFQYSDESTDNAYVAYAGLLAGILTTSSTTNKPVGPNVKLVFEFTTEQLERLSELGITTFRNSVLNDLVVSNGVTAAPPESELHYVCNVRMIQLALSFTKMQLDKFLGEDINYLEENNIIEDTLTELYDSLVESDVIKNYDFNVAIDKPNGGLVIYLDLKTLYMIESVKASAAAAFVK